MRRLRKQISVAVFSAVRNCGVFVVRAGRAAERSTGNCNRGQAVRRGVLLQSEVGACGRIATLFKKNHYPLLQKQVEMGRMLSVSAVTPRYHTTEDGRWDYRVTIVFINATVANEPFYEKALIKQLYPDQATYQKEEQRRFEILDAHWDLPIKDLDLNSK